MPRLSPAVLALSLIAAVAATPAEANPRAFVSSTGSDANTASACGLLSACRTFAAAMTVVDPGGEIVALDGAGYGAVTITKSVTITSNPGFYAGIAASSSHAVTIATAGVNVILRGLAINKLPSVGNFSGVAMTNGASLSIENCVISNFLSGAGVGVSTPALVRIVDSLFRSNNTGVELSGGATGTISTSKIVGDPCCGSTGVAVFGFTASTTTTAAISDTVMANSNNYAVFVEANTATAVAKASVTRSTLSNGGYGAYVTAQSGGTAVLTVSNSMVTGNSATGLAQVGTGTLRSLVNNTVDQNGTNATGTITYLPPM